MGLVDGRAPPRLHAGLSVFNGPKPSIIIAPDQAAECQQVTNWLRARTAEGLEPQEMAVIVRSQEQIDRAKRAAELSGLKSSEAPPQTDESAVRGDSGEGILPRSATRHVGARRFGTWASVDSTTLAQARGCTANMHLAGPPSAARIPNHPQFC